MNRDSEPIGEGLLPSRCIGRDVRQVEGRLASVEGPVPDEQHEHFVVGPRARRDVAQPDRHQPAGHRRRKIDRRLPRVARLGEAQHLDEFDQFVAEMESHGLLSWRSSEADKDGQDESWSLGKSRAELGKDQATQAEVKVGEGTWIDRQAGKISFAEAYHNTRSQAYNLTGGQIDINVHSNGSLIKHPDILRAVSTGQVPIGEDLIRYAVRLAAASRPWVSAVRCR